MEFDFDYLVREDRVHRSIYLDPDIYQLEMERIFGRTWVYIGHESQVPKVGDFLTSAIGSQPVVMARHTTADVRILFNRCGHRGAKVVNEENGNVRQFRCPYHGWTFNTDGSLSGVPLANGYPDSFSLENPALSMVPVPRADSYGGFVFASLSDIGPDLKSYLGSITTSIDEINARAPDGKVELTGGIHKYLFPGNWKLQTENLCDMYHPAFAHESTLRADGRQFQRGDGDKGMVVSNKGGGATEHWDETGMWAFNYGHAYQGPMPQTGEPDTPLFRRYKEMLVAKHGENRTQKILKLTRHNSMIFPNLCIQALNLHVRTIRPINAALTEVRVYPIKLTGAPEEMHRDMVHHLNQTHSATSLIQTDDLEIFRRQQQGLESQAGDWIYFARGLGAEQPADQGGMRANGTAEIGMRNQHMAWLDHMTAPQLGTGA